MHLLPPSVENQSKNQAGRLSMYLALPAFSFWGGLLGLAGRCRLLHRHALGQIAGFVHIGAFGAGSVVGQQLQGHNVQDGA